MFPAIGLMMAHGTAGLFQWPMFGYFLAFHALLVLVERPVRVCLGLHAIKATVRVLNGEAADITAAAFPMSASGSTKRGSTSSYNPQD